MGQQRHWPFRACVLSLDAEAPLVTAQVAHPMHFAPSILEVMDCDDTEQCTIQSRGRQ